MESIQRSSMNKKQKPNHKGRDIISNLPDFIIGFILSFLPTKEAFQTCVLSKKWINLWTLITKLHFEDTPHAYHKIRKTSFQNFVYKVLSVNTLSSIQSFSLSLSVSHAPRHVNKWISDILNRRVKELYIDLKEKLDINSLHPILKTSSLEVLVLKMNHWAMKVPTFVSLSFLTVLELSGITFSFDSCDDPEKFIFNFPVLRKYEAENCTWVNVKCVTFEVPLLEVLLIKHTPESMSHAVVELNNNTVIKFCASLLSQFSYDGYALPHAILLDLDLSIARIASANIHLHQLLGESVEKLESFACELLKQFNNNVECLKYEVSKKEYPYLCLWPMEPIYVLEFGTLTRLELGQVAVDVLIDFLQKTPFLKTLMLKVLLEFDEDGLNPDNVPECISNLQVVNFGKLARDDHVLRFAKFVMENAQVLERVSFWPTWTRNKQWCSRRIEKLRKKILSFKRSVKLEFIEFSSFRGY